VDNEYSWLDFTDIVFIDPVSTGYSRPVDGESPSQFHGLDEDLRSVGEFIRLYTTKYKRWPSPKFLAGESYGTTRAAGLTGTLQDGQGMYLNGIVLLSTVLNFQTLQFNTGNDVPYPLFLPTYTATAWYHKKLAPDLQADFDRAISEARAWAAGDYTLALAKGDALTAAERADVVKKLARYTGLSERYVDDANLRVRIFNFTKELLRDRGLTVGRLDTRYVGMDADSIGASPEFDPSMSAITGPYTACLYDYVRTELNYENDKTYEVLTGRVQPWSYAGAQNRYVNVADTLRGAITKNTSLRVMVAAGYFDLATPFFAAEYTMNHLGLPESLRANVEIHHYGAGHMMYIRQPDLAQLRQDVAEFYAKASGVK
jgi:carboxypeptidase C (cathepsin A)